ncbi:MAG TPA: hypothetical protein VGD78_00055, partial [Chthoniobacterales bacterium]
MAQTVRPEGTLAGPAEGRVSRVKVVSKSLTWEAEPWLGGRRLTQRSDGFTAKAERSLNPEASLTGLKAGEGVVDEPR